VGKEELRMGDVRDIEINQVNMQVFRLGELETLLAQAQPDVLKRHWRSAHIGRELARKSD
jgi:hypothetical protein